MPDCLLRLVAVTAGRDVRGCVHVYYGRCYVGAINPAGERWRVWLHDVVLGDFERIDHAGQAVAEWYYGSGAEAHIES